MQTERKWTERKWAESEQFPRLDRDFFTRDGITVAKDLLGKIMAHETPYGTVRGIVTEVESYMGENDKGSHTYGGRRTERTEPMYHIGGTSYVYLIYGMYSCMNVACMTDGIPQAVLLRSVVPADPESERIMQMLRLAPVNSRQEKQGKPLYTIEKLPDSIRKHLADGPGKLCIAMDITRADNDIDMVESDRFYFTEGLEITPEQIKAGKRIGIDYAEEAADYLWRFYVEQLEW
jgi:DNA-3-methyladenine glycosylase